MIIRRRLAISGFAIVAAVLMLASTAYACTIFEGKMKVEVVSNGTISTADGSKLGMSHCVDPRLTADGGGHSAVATADGFIPDGVGSLTIDIKISTSATTECPTANSLAQDDYFVSWNSDFARDCMVQAGGVPEYVAPTFFTVGAGGTGGPTTYTIPGVEGTGFGKYVGVCITSTTTHSGVLVGNRAPIKVI